LEDNTIKNRRSSFLKKVLYGLGILLALVVVLFVVLFFWPYPSNNYPSWSPDSSRIAFSRHSEMWVVNADGTNQTKLLDNGLSPSWSPDSTKIAFIHFPLGYSGHVESPDGDIWVMDADGTNQMNLTNGAGWDRDPSWSTDSTRIVFVRQSDSDFDIWVMDTDGSNQTKLTSGLDEVFHPTWSPDGTKIAFQSVSGRNTDIWVMDADGSNQKSLTNSSTWYSNPEWLPDGRITFSGEGGIWVMNADGSNQKILIPMPEGSFYWALSPDGFYNWAWSSDGSRIAYVSDVGSGTDIWVSNADGTNRMKLIK
jgi:Tol biopolymer transport system component